MSKNKDASKKAQNDNARDNRKAAQKALHRQIESLPDPVALSQALMDAYQQSQPLFMDMLQKMGQTPPSAPDFANFDPDPMNVGGAAMNFMTSMSANPLKFWDMQMNYAQKQAQLWQNSIAKMLGQDSHPVIEPKQGDRRFRAESWNDSVFFDFIKQYYLLACDFVEQNIENNDDLSNSDKQKLKFTSKLMMDALSPSNFAMTNPEVIHETIESGGMNLVRGLQNMREDLERGHGQLKISTTDYSAFKLGENIATTPGHVVFENDLMQLIQYEPQSHGVFKRPLLVVPPWINKFYILDLRPESSFIRWAVEQGHTVFCISWVNPDAKLAQKDFDAYMFEGVLTAMDRIKDITGEPDCNAVGYCLGGTLLATTLAYLKAKKQDKRIASATFLTTLVDFAEAGDMKLFMDDEQIDEMIEMMSRTGVLKAEELQRTFSLLRANDLIWSFVVNNYLLGKEPFPFDLLYWNDDSTNMPAAMHSFYLRNMYRDNLLTRPGGIEIGDVKIDVSKVKTPAYFLSTKEDHIAPWKATYQTTQLMSGPKTFTLAASGHIAGVINPPSKEKYCFWSASKTPEKPDEWMKSAKETAGSWWPHWEEWIKHYANGQVEARQISHPIEPAPGRYVQVKSL
ncbi:MAG: class I poly(R)-hydroxyalkanoic acid synthase [Rhodospirillales bacterium]|nr:class I poly(R)-hydroxyalkanoic acid synthase [Rhodospirillales bacterium]